MFAVIRTGGKQYRVTENTRIEVERLPGDPGADVALGDVLMVGGVGAEPQVGAPLLADAAVFAEIVEQKRGRKILVFKKKRRKHYRRTRGHRQELTVLRITGISPTGEPPQREAAPAIEDTMPAVAAPDAVDSTVMAEPAAPPAAATDDSDTKE